MDTYEKTDSKFRWCSFVVDGKRYRKSTKQTSKAKASTAADAIMQAVIQGKNFQFNKKNRPPTLAEFSVYFLKCIEDGRSAPNTKKYYKNGWRLLSTQPIADIRIDRITTTLADAVTAPGSPSNVNNALSTLRRMLTLAYKEERLTKVPKLNFLEENQRERLVTAEEERVILAECPPTLRDAYLLILDAGMRPGEASALAWSSVDFIRGVILVTRVSTKTGKKGRRFLAMSTRVREMLMRRAKLHDTWVFPTKYFKRRGHTHITTHTISNQFTNLKRAKGWPTELVLYSARHTFATDLMEETGNLVKTQRTLGHKNARTTERYLHPETVELGAIMDARNERRVKQDSHVLSHGTVTVN